MKKVRPHGEAEEYIPVEAAGLCPAFVRDKRGDEYVLFVNVGPFGERIPSYRMLVPMRHLQSLIDLLLKAKRIAAEAAK